MPDRPFCALQHNQDARCCDETLLCDVCQNAAIAFLPGSEPIHELFALSRGVARRQWCLAHAPWAVPA